MEKLKEFIENYVDKLIETFAPYSEDIGNLDSNDCGLDKFKALDNLLQKIKNELSRYIITLTSLMNLSLSGSEVVDSINAHLESLAKIYQNNNSIDDFNLLIRLSEPHLRCTEKKINRCNKIIEHLRTPEKKNDVEQILGLLNNNLEILCNGLVKTEDLVKQMGVEINKVTDIEQKLEL